MGDRERLIKTLCTQRDRVRLRETVGTKRDWERLRVLRLDFWIPNETGRDSQRLWVPRDSGKLWIPKETGRDSGYREGQGKTWKDSRY